MLAKVGLKTDEAEAFSRGVVVFVFSILMDGWMEIIRRI